MMTNEATKQRKALHLAAGLLLGLTSGIAQPNPTGELVLEGAADFVRNGATLTVTNSPGTIIQWDQFNIEVGETTHFDQQSAQSAVLNRVGDVNPSQIFGRLTSDGQVFLINPNGVVFNEGSQVDVAALVASSLGLSNQDFLNGAFNFTGDADAGSVDNVGALKAGVNGVGGNVILIAPKVNNKTGGAIEVGAGGNIVLAAGQQLTLADWSNPTVQFQLRAAADQIINAGQLNAAGGAARLFAGAIEHSGGIQADSVSVDAAGVVELFASDAITLGSAASIQANGANAISGAPGGSIHIESESGAVTVAGQISAVGSQAQGGGIKILGDTIAMQASAALDASGDTGGGVILVGGGAHCRFPVAIPCSSPSWTVSRVGLRPSQ